MSRTQDIGLLVLRVSVGAMMAFGHGWGKFSKLLSGAEIQFPDPIGVGSELSFALAAGAEFVCALLIALGLFTRLNLIPFAFTMLVAVFIVHGDDPFGDKEKALLYLAVSVGLFITGPGRYTAQRLFLGRFSPENRVVHYLTR